MQALIQKTLLFRMDTDVVPSDVDTGVVPLHTGATLVVVSDVDPGLVLSDVDTGFAPFDIDVDLVVVSRIGSGLAVPFRSHSDLAPTYPWLQYAN